ncbi:MAG: 3-oxoacyl-ACP reductase FabG [Clostridia bacterium]|nr:3-oxoacyl-ACP reductase FabG [Clostridia bacterium]
MSAAKTHTVWVTGSSRGIGLAVAEKFARKGHRVALHCVHRVETLTRETERLRATGLNVMQVTGDIASEADCFRMAHEIAAVFGPVEILVNNAGIALEEKLLTDCTAEELARVAMTDLVGPMLCAKAVVPHMVSDRAGSIVNIASYLGITGCSCETPYAAAKAGVIGFTKSLAAELAPSGVRVNAVAPGYIPTEMNAEFDEETVRAIANDIPLGRLGSAEEIAEAVYFLAMEETASFITGQTLAVDGGSSL